MAGLDDLNPNTPLGLATPTEGDNELRAIKSKVREFAGVEHALDGKHKFPVVAVLPAFGTAGRLVVKTTIGVADELWYDTGTAWVKITSNQDVITYTSSFGLLTHKTANPIDHPDNSITYLKILAGEIRHKHLGGGTSDASIAALVNALNADALHTHSTAGIEDGSITLEKLSVAAISDYTDKNHAMHTKLSLTAGNNIYHSNASETSSLGASYVKVKEIRIGQLVNSNVGFRIKFDIKTNNFNYAAYGRIYKNGVAIGMERNTIPPEGGYVTFSEDFSGINPGDLIQLYVRNADPTLTTYARNFILYVSQNVNDDAIQKTTTTLN